MTSIKTGGPRPLKIIGMKGSRKTHKKEKMLRLTHQDFYFV